MDAEAGMGENIMGEALAKGDNVMSNAIGNIIGMNPGDLAKFRERVDNGIRPVFCNDINLRGVLFHDLDLRDVDFRGCDLSCTIFCDCKLDCAMFFGANLAGTVFVNVLYENSWFMYEHVDKFGRLCGKEFRSQSGEWSEIYTVVVPPMEIKGGFVGYKVLSDPSNFCGILIAKLWIPEDAKRVVFERCKCRASKVRVEEIRHLDRSGKVGTCVNFGYSPISDNIMRYVVGCIVEADSFDESYQECSNGIHFFLTEEEAIEYGVRYC